MRWLILCQIPSPDSVVSAATEVSWIAGLLALLVITAFGCFGWMIKHETTRHSEIERGTQQDAREREIRYSSRITALEDALRVELVGLVRTNTEMMSKMVVAADSICRAADEMMGAVKQFMTLMNSGACPLADPARIRLWEDYQRVKSKEANE
jgi:hypothetical protein